jgi:capsular polysaccharide biosynthesis protein
MLLDYARILLRRWWLVILPPILIVAVTLLTARPAPPVMYQVNMSFGAGFAPEPIRLDAYNYDRHYNWLASEYTAQGFSLIISKGVFAENVAQRLAAKGITLSAPVLGSIRSEVRSSVFGVTVNWPEARQAEQIAQAIVDELTENYLAYWPQLTGIEQSPVKLMDPIAAVPVAPPLRDRFDLPVRILLGLIVGALLALLWNYFDPAVQERRDVERMGLNIVAEIPAK